MHRGTKVATATMDERSTEKAHNGMIPCVPELRVLLTCCRDGLNVGSIITIVLGGRLRLQSHLSRKLG
ncbi:hypothetical protein Tco_0929290 [Tanacetum coccineum]